MKSITIKIVELKDILRLLSSFLDRIIFLFSKPKYKMGSIINIGDWGKNLRIISINRDWDYCNWGYSTDKSELDFSEGLIDFYMLVEK